MGNVERNIKRRSQKTKGLKQKTSRLEIKDLGIKLDFAAEIKSSIERKSGKKFVNKQIENKYR